ncbi:precorrin-3B C(17)-methyltransferase [Thermoplasma sp. Kam2015]|uniref:precorrin-3B C(17)-methyltransferase n=1 Tax=Thermoplasma sp. Kam2015 TaxID=2094122 RepID=UPI000D8F675E|nr:precorrin-3B C(17)-methyltransferase [Thermoplasma sp. Kam2015]PYB68380.1 precorrin-3B C(17)-methyltransferase [Thermoplasma sp. Kam2015]
MYGKIYIIGIGPGSPDHMTPAARKALASSDVIIGFSLYVSFVREEFPEKKYEISGMQNELARARRAIDLADQGMTVAVISSGDAGIYGIAAPTLEMMQRRGSNVEVEIVPGISALSSAASLLGSPLTNDFAVISMSDLLTPLEVVMKRAEIFAKSDIVTVIYNPRGSRFPDNLRKAIDIFAKYRDPNTVVGIVRNAYREGQSVKITKLSEIVPEEIDMLTTVIVGNSETFVYRDMMATRRGYSKKYSIDA